MTGILPIKKYGLHSALNMFTEYSMTNPRELAEYLTLLFNNTFATKVPVSKIAEKMKAYGLWEIFVTDSFDEYIDNLVIGTDSEIDEDDLFQEEFF